MKVTDPATDEVSSPITLLIHAFNEAVDRSAVVAEPTGEADQIEMLVIVANATHRALSQAADLSHDLSCGDTDSVREAIVPSLEEDYNDWLGTASRLYERIVRLNSGDHRGGPGDDYESLSWREFKENWDSVKFGVMEDYRARREAERKAMPSARLLALVSKLQGERSAGHVEEKA